MWIFLSLILTASLAHAMNISEVKEIPITDEIQGNIKLESGSRLYLNQLAFKKDQNTLDPVRFNLKLECKALRKKSVTTCKLVHLEQAESKNL